MPVATEDGESSIGCSGAASALGSVSGSPRTAVTNIQVVTGGSGSSSFAVVALAATCTDGDARGDARMS